jgi:hypothetical protein
MPSDNAAITAIRILVIGLITALDFFSLRRALHDANADQANTFRRILFRASAITRRFEQARP